MKRRDLVGGDGFAVDHWCSLCAQVFECPSTLVSMFLPNILFHQTSPSSYRRKYSRFSSRLFRGCHRQRRGQPILMRKMVPPNTNHKWIESFSTDRSSDCYYYRWVCYVEKGKLCHGIVVATSVSRRKQQPVLQVIGCHFPSFFRISCCETWQPHPISLDSVVDIYDDREESDGTSFRIASVKDATCSSMWTWLVRQVESILFSVSYHRVEAMYQSFCKMDYAKRYYPIGTFCKYLFPGRHDVLLHWIVTGLVLKRMEQHFRRGPAAQGFSVESKASRRSKSMVAWKWLWSQNPSQTNQETTPWERGRWISSHAWLCLDAVDYIGHLERCCLEGCLDRKARNILSSLNRPVDIASARSLLEECGSDISQISSSSSLEVHESQLVLLPREETSMWIEEMCRRVLEQRRSHTSHLDSSTFHSYCFDTKDSIALDDAISMERCKDGEIVIVSVHIIDVASFLPAGCPLDEEARRRQETWYMKTKTCHMLPPKLLQCLSFSTELSNDTLAARFYIDLFQNYKLVREQLVFMTIPPISRRISLSSFAEHKDPSFLQDWNILVASMCGQGHKNQDNLSNIDIRDVLDICLTKASRLVWQQLQSIYSKDQQFPKNRGQKYLGRAWSIGKKRLGTRPLRKYEDLIIQRILMQSMIHTSTYHASASSIPPYYEEYFQEQRKPNPMKYIRLSQLYTAFFQQLLFQRGFLSSSRSPSHYVWSDRWEAATTSSNRGWRIYLWGIWFSYPAPVPNETNNVNHHKTKPLLQGIVQEIHLFRKQCQIHWQLPTSASKETLPVQDDQP